MPAPMITTFPGGTPGTPASRMPRPPWALLEIERALLDREPPGHLAHRREEREAAVGALHRLVGDGDAPALLERSRQLAARPPGGGR